MADSKLIAQLVEKYRKAAVSTDDLSDSKQQNKAADTVHACFQQLRKMEDGRAAIIALMSDPNPSVRTWAAAHSLLWCPEIARRNLESLRDENVFPYSFDAEMTLKEFEKGTLTFDY